MNLIVSFCSEPLNLLVEECRFCCPDIIAILIQNHNFI